MMYTTAFGYTWCILLTVIDHMVYTAYGYRSHDVLRQVLNGMLKKDSKVRPMVVREDRRVARVRLHVCVCVRVCASLCVRERER